MKVPVGRYQRQPGCVIGLDSRRADVMLVGGELLGLFGILFGSCFGYN